MMQMSVQRLFVNIGVLKEAIKELQGLEEDIQNCLLKMSVMQARFSLESLIQELEQYKKETMG